MLSDKKRLLILIGVAVVLVVVYVSISGVPGFGGSGSDDPDDSVDPTPSRVENPSEPEKAAIRRREVKTRRREVFRLAVQKKPENLPKLKKAAADPEWRVRHAGVDGVGRLGREGDPQFLIGVLNNRKEQAEVRASAAERLGEMRYWEAGPAIMDAMEDSSELLRARAGVALRRIVVVDMGYRANDPLDSRRQSMQKIRKMWPWFYEKFAHRDKVKG